LLPCRPLPVLGARLCGLLASLALGASVAHAFQLTSIRPTKDTRSVLWVEVQLEDAIEPRVAKSLGRGMPATLTLHAELWRRRRGWFDRMERAVEATFRLRYDVWGDNWRLDRPGAAPLVVSTLDSLQRALEHTLALPVAPLDRFAPETSCYLVVSASLRPLNVEDVEEVEGWLSGEVKEKGHSGLGFLTGIPRSLFEAARNFAGFGDERSRLISTDFTPANLRPEDH
jgi:uncharacterized protein DUF4390